MSALDAIRKREQAKIRPVPVKVKKPKKAAPEPVVEEPKVEIAPDYAESAE